MAVWELILRLPSAERTYLRQNREFELCHFSASAHQKCNFGDCFAYALAKMLDEPLLFKGNDFVLTDIAVYPLQ